MSDQVAGMRRNYGRGQLHREDLDADPIRQFARWFEDATAAGLTDPNAMSLATATASGETSLRTVLLKGYGDDGFLFFTNLESTKATQIAENPNVSLLFPWLPLERQVIINGTAARLPLVDVAKYFLTRPRDSRVAAWVSQQSRVVSARRLLEAKFDEMMRKFGDGEIPVPSFWGGFRVAPRTIEFWQGGTHRLHDRFLYRRSAPDAAWTIERLAP
jgi:pyridoxamine 5'-phosphate oxidase